MPDSQEDWWQGLQQWRKGQQEQWGLEGRLEERKAVSYNKGRNEKKRRAN